MEISEILNYYVNKEKNLIEVSFRTIDDNDDVLRTDQIDYSLAEEYGYKLETEDFDFFSDEIEEDNLEEEIEIDEETLITFLNEYYTINSNTIPKAHFF